jgi:hypothetical protein
MKPLLRFVALGAVLFAVLRHPRVGGDPSGRVGRSDEAVLLNAALQRRLGEDDVVVQRRQMDNARMLGLESEVASSLHLDDGDPIIRRRLVQQMLLQLQTEARRSEPTETQLREYLAAHPDRFALPERVRVEHVFFSRTRRGDQAEDDAHDALRRVGAAHLSSDAGDPSLWPTELPLQTAAELEKIFGATAPAISGAPLDEWSGPYRTAWGYHLVRVVERVEPTTPQFETVRAAVRLALLNDRAEEHVAQTLAALR